MRTLLEPASSSSSSGWYVISFSLSDCLTTDMPLLKLGNVLSSYLVDLSEGESASYVLELCDSIPSLLMKEKTICMVGRM